MKVQVEWVRTERWSAVIEIPDDWPPGRVFKEFPNVPDHAERIPLEIGGNTPPPYQDHVTMVKRVVE